MGTDLHHADIVEVVINEDGNRIWVNLRESVEGPPINELRISDVGNILVLDDRYTYPVGDLVDYLMTEIRELRLKVGQAVEAQKRAESNHRYERRYMEASKASGRKEAYGNIERLLTRILADYEKDRRG